MSQFRQAKDRVVREVIESDELFVKQTALLILDTANTTVFCFVFVLVFVCLFVLFVFDFVFVFVLLVLFLFLFFI